MPLVFFPQQQQQQPIELSLRRLTLPVQGDGLSSRNMKFCPQRTKDTQDFSQFTINFDKILGGEDRRTTLMIKNIPNKYTINLLRDELNTDYDGKYDFLYLPVDSSNGCNVGYAFINLLDPMQVLMFYDTFKGKKWNKFSSMKQCEITYAKYQGKKELSTQYAGNSAIDEKRPFVASFNENFVNNIEVPIVYLEKFKILYPQAVYKLEGNYSFSFNNSVGKKEYSCN